MELVKLRTLYGKHTRNHVKWDTSIEIYFHAIFIELHKQSIK